VRLPRPVRDLESVQLHTVRPLARVARIHHHRQTNDTI
jgi:hypothetical protein